MGDRVLIRENLSAVLRWMYRQPVEQIAKHSFVDYHAKGMDYVCLKRADNSTLKLYVIRPNAEMAGPDYSLVNPHDHAYDFWTQVLWGQLENLIYEEHPVDAAEAGSKVIQKFTYASPLRGGAGFGPVCKAVKLVKTSTSYMREGMGYMMSSQSIHTIRPVKGQLTILLLHQQEDQPDKKATRLYMPTPEPPCTEGMYQPMPPNRVVEIMAMLEDLKERRHD